jgi:hypothetical protein
MGKAEVFVHFLLFRTRDVPRLIVLIACLATPLTFTSCGGSGADPARSLPPAIRSAEPVLLFTGSGTSSSDVAAIEVVLNKLDLGYTTADSFKLNAMTQPQIAGYKLMIVPGGDSIAIGQNLAPSTAANIRGAVANYGLHYLGICAGAFFGGYSIYNGVNLTGSVYFDFYQDEFKGIHIEPILISLPGGSQMDVYWQDGPQLSGWGNAVAKYPDGSSAISEGLSGKGFVIFTGVHLEAPASWRGSMSFVTPIDVDLAYAGTVVQAAFDGTPLPHF